MSGPVQPQLLVVDGGEMLRIAQQMPDEPPEFRAGTHERHRQLAVAPFTLISSPRRSEEGNEIGGAGGGPRRLDEALQRGDRIRQRYRLQMPVQPVHKRVPVSLGRRRYGLVRDVMGHAHESLVHEAQTDVLPTRSIRADVFGHVAIHGHA